MESGAELNRKRVNEKISAEKREYVLCWWWK